jgi:ketosteroid isomerase-like protein
VRGLDAYMDTWELFFRCADRPVAFDFTEVEITAGSDVSVRDSDRKVHQPRRDGKAREA